MSNDTQTVVVKRPISPPEVASALRDFKTYEPTPFRRLNAVQRARAVHDFGASPQEMADILSEGGPKVTAKDVERWCSENPGDDDAKSTLFRRFLVGFVLTGDVRPLKRYVTLPAQFAAKGGEDGVKAPRTRAKGSGNFSEAIASLEG
jgi:hypothetical protein